MDQAIEQRTGEAFLTEDHCLLLEGQIRCHHGRSAFVALAEHFGRKFM
jgi:hypothetical protein